MKKDVKILDINFINIELKEKIASYLLELFPKEKYYIQYVYSPFEFGYNIDYSLTQINNNVLINFYSPKEIYNKLKNRFEIDFGFDEDFDFKNEFRLLNFLTSIGYELPKDRIIREMITAITKEKTIINYDESGKLIK